MASVYAIVRGSSDNVVGRRGVLCFVVVNGYVYGEDLLRAVAERLGGTVVRKGEHNHVLVREDGEWHLDTLRGPAEEIYRHNVWFRVPVIKASKEGTK